MKVVFFETMPGEREALSPHLPPGQEIVFLEDTLTEDTVDQAAGAQVISVFVKSQITQAVIDGLPDLRLITTRSMGVDHIDVAYAKSKDILVNNVQTYASHPVAEFTFALLLAVTRKLYPAYSQLRERMDFNQVGLKGFNLFGKTLGIAGTGRIGKNVITIAKSFGMNILGYDLFPDEAFAIAQAFRYVPLDELIATSDVISLHVPYTNDTHHLINAAAFARMKKGVVIINTARGEVMDTHALIAALRDGTVWGAGLDVLEQERDITKDPTLLSATRALVTLSNVVITPHIAYETREALSEISRVTAETISHFIAGERQSYL